MRLVLLVALISLPTHAAEKTAPTKKDPLAGLTDTEAVQTCKFLGEHNPKAVTPEFARQCGAAMAREDDRLRAEREKAETERQKAEAERQKAEADQRLEEQERERLRRESDNWRQQERDRAAANARAEAENSARTQEWLRQERMAMDCGFGLDSCPTKKRKTNCTTRQVAGNLVTECEDR